MNILHEKSPCCRGKIRHFGKRRRQCAFCHKTWRVWKKKRGRKKKRTSSEFVLKYLHRETPSLYSLAKIHKKSGGQLKLKLQRSLRVFLENTPWPQIPSHEPLIAIADAMIITLARRTYTFYFILLKPINSNKAIVTEPYVREGSENYWGWQDAFAMLPQKVFALICALVSDEHRGLVYLARRKRWVHQGCVFHLIARVQGRRSRWIKSRHRLEGERLYRLVSHAICVRSEDELRLRLLQLMKMRRETTSPVLKKIISGFVKSHKIHRAYLDHPELGLPRTSNSAEHLISVIRQLLNRAHGFRTLRSLQRWINALLKMRRTVTCNSYLSTKFSA